MDKKMSMVTRISRYIAVLFAVVAMQSCVDDFEFVDPNAIPEGEGDISLELNFEPLASGNLGRSAIDAPAGDAIKSLKDASILFYDAATGRLAKDMADNVMIYHFTRDQLGIRSVPRDPQDASNGQLAETHTDHGTATLKDVKFGQYYIFAVANLGGSKSSTRQKLAEPEVLEAIQTVDGLRNLPVQWCDSIIGENAGMCGYFTEVKQSSPNLGSDPAPVTFKRAGMTMHAWLRRVASKVTIVFDASRLREDTYIYIRRATIHDIPSECYLGAPYGIADSKKMIGESRYEILYGEGADEDYEKWPCLTSGSGRFEFKGGHSETAPALFFYENMQGVHPDKDKRQQLDKNTGLVLDRDQLKDEVEYGTYIEVEAYYDSRAKGNEGKGRIIYRFMLGKDTEFDYDAERNHHYKLTMNFLGNANDVDWHIDYKEEPGMYIPNPYFISYLYNHELELPIKINGKLTGNLEAEIFENDWKPDSCQDMTYDYPDFYNNGPWLGFLSLRATAGRTRFGDHVGMVNNVPDSKPGVQDPDYLRKYWLGQGDNVRNSTPSTSFPNIVTYYPNEKVNPRGTRTYTMTDGLHTEDGVDGPYRVVRNDKDDITTIYLHLYTRAKQMVPTSGFSGNNPFVGYQRKAKIRFKATIDGEPVTKEITVYQVRRVINPKGIYRRHNNTKDFKVVLKELDGASSSSFKTFKSKGSWRAFIARGDKSAFGIDGHSGYDTIKGKTGTPIAFNVNFNGCGANESKCAVLRVEYHDETCVHLIFLRQGYAPIRMNEKSERKWHTSNRETKDKDADIPTEEGSLFRFGNWDDPIAARNNYDESSKPPVKSDFVNHVNDPLYIAGGGQKKWNAIASFDRETATFGDTTGIHVATVYDYQCLRSSDDMEEGYGVLYADDADSVATSVDKAYGYCKALGRTKGYGMRGCFSYNKSETSPYGGNNIFFPIGQSGHGRRKNYHSGWAGTEVGSAVKRYSGRVDYYGANKEYVPMFYDKFLRNGAVYYVNRRQGGYLGLDINYFTFDFSLVDLSSGNAYGEAVDGVTDNRMDACYLRMVE